LKNTLRFSCALMFLALIIGLTPIADTATSEDQPTIAKDSVQITAFTFNVYKKNYDVLMDQSPAAASFTCNSRCPPDHG